VRASDKTIGARGPGQGFAVLRPRIAYHGEHNDSDERYDLYYRRPPSIMASLPGRVVFSALFPFLSDEQRGRSRTWPFFKAFFAETGRASGIDRAASEHQVGCRPAGRWGNARMRFGSGPGS
jgi:hypothetical protein